MRRGDRAALADVILRLAGEVRQQLGLQLAISRTLVDLRVVNHARLELHKAHLNGVESRWHSVCAMRRELRA